MTQEEYNPEQIRALIVDDHDPIRKAIKRVVVSLGIKNIIECFDGTDAIKNLREKHIDLVLCDIYMRKVDGFDVLKFVRSREVGSDIPFILISGEGNKDDIVKSSNLGADDYIIKPFRAENLEQKIKAAIQNYYNPTPLLKALRYGDRLLMEQNFDAAITAFESAIELDDKSQRAKHSLAFAFLLRGNLKKGVHLLKKNIDEAPRYYRNYETLANVYINTKNFDLAIDAMIKELSLNPKQPSRQAQLAQLLLKKGEAASAIDHFREALKENSKHGPSLFGMGQAYALVEDIEKAVYYFKRLRRHHPKSQKALKAIVKYCLDANQSRKAELTLIDEKNLNPDRLDTYPILAKFYAMTDRDKEALTVLAELFEKEPEHLEGLRIKGQIEIKIKRWDLAYKTYSQLTKLEPAHDIYLSLADCLFHMSRFKECIDVLNKAILIDPKNSKSSYLLSMCFLETQQYGKAFAMMLRAKNHGWDKKDATEKMQSLRDAIRKRQKLVFNKIA